GPMVELLGGAHFFGDILDRAEDPGDRLPRAIAERPEGASDPALLAAPREEAHLAKARLAGAEAAEPLGRERDIGWGEEARERVAGGGEIVQRAPEERREARRGPLEPEARGARRILLEESTAEAEVGGELREASERAFAGELGRAPLGRARARHPREDQQPG